MLLAIIYVCSPFLRSNITTSNDAETEKALYEARIKELDSEYALGRIDETSLKTAKTEEARKLLKRSTSNSDTTTGFLSGKFTLPATAIFISLFSIVIYMSVGTPEVAFQHEAIEETSQASLEDLLEVAEKRLKEVPDDLRGWLVVAPVYVRQGNYGLSDQDSELTFALGEVFVEQSQGQITDEALMYFQKTIELNKAHASATFMLGMAAFQRQENEEAVRIWQALVDSAQGNEEWVSVVQHRIDSLKTEIAGTQAPALSQETIESAEQLSDNERAEMINRMVAGLAERLEDDPDDKPSWARLIRSYIVLGKYEDAQTAIDKAVELFPGDTDFASFAAEMRNQIQQATVKDSQ